MSSVTSANVASGLQRTYVSSYGSRPKKDMYEWANQEFDEPVPIKMTLSPILNLFDKPYMKDIGVDYKGILKFLAPRYWKYCDVNKGNLGIEKCRNSEQKVRPQNKT